MADQQRENQQRENQQRENQQRENQQRDGQHWDDRYRRLRESELTGSGNTQRPPRELLVQAVAAHFEFNEAMPTPLALDLAGGTGAEAIWLTSQGFDTTLVDVSPVALEMAKQTDASLRTVCTDLERGAAPAGPWDLIHVANYLNRDMLGGLVAMLSATGLLVVAVATVENLKRHKRPPARFLVNPEELLTLIGPAKTISFTEAWRENGRHEAWLVAARS